MWLFKKSFVPILALSLLSGQGMMNAFGLGHFNANQGITTAGNGLNSLTPAFQSDVSLTNPTTWQNLDYTYLSLSYSGNENRISELSSKVGYSGLSSATWIIPVKSKGAFGLSLSPYADQRISIASQDTTIFYSFDDTLRFAKSFDRSGGIMSFKMGSSYLLNDMFSLGLSFDLLFGSSRQNESIFFEGSSIVKTSRTRYSGVLANLFLTTFIRDNLSLFTRIQQPLKPLDALYTEKHLFDDANGNGYHDSGSPSDFPYPDSVSANKEIRLSEVHSPSEFAFGIQSNFNKMNSVSMEVRMYKDSGNLVGNLTFPGNDWIGSSQDFNVSYVRSPNDLSINWIDKFSFRTGLAYKTHELSQSKIKISELGLALGFGFKFKTVGNQFDLNYYVGKRNYSENYNTEIVQQLQVGVSLADRWFVKRRQK